MSKLKESVVTLCEKNFLLKSLHLHKRLDGRAFLEFRDFKIEFGADWGCCYVSLGETKVLAQVSCEIQQPKSSRPSEGVLYINVELSPMGAPNFEAGRPSELSILLNRHLEQCLKVSKAVDLESLCIKVKEKVWAFRVDVNVLNHEGNILDAASIAALSALAHFRRPDITFDGEDFIIHTYQQRDPIPTVMHHYPVCVSFAVFNNGEIIVADPNLLEENIAETQLNISTNAYKELCGLHLGGSTSLPMDSILRTTELASQRAKTVTEQIKYHIGDDTNKRLQRSNIGFHISLQSSTNNASSYERLVMCLDKWTMMKKRKRAKPAKLKVKNNISKSSVESLGDKSAVLLPEDRNEWVVSDADSDEGLSKQCTTNQQAKIKDQSFDSSEEENVIIIHEE